MPRFSNIPSHGKYMLYCGLGIACLYTLCIYLQYQLNLFYPDVVIYREPGNTTGMFSVRVYDEFWGGAGLCLMWLLFLFGVRTLPHRYGAWIQRMALVLMIPALVSLLHYPDAIGIRSSAATNSFWLSGSMRMQLYLDPLYTTSLIVNIATILTMFIIYRDSHRYSQYYMHCVCPSCGYDLRGNDEATHCPECGVFCGHVISRHHVD